VTAPAKVVDYYVPIDRGIQSENVILLAKAADYFSAMFNLELLDSDLVHDNSLGGMDDLIARFRQLI
jgi:hypothetical protein